MGLLDDAIREHLELKRLRGADPSEVTRQEREALEPLDGSDRVRSVGDARSREEPAGQHADPPADGAQHREEPEPIHAGEETAELDMRTVLSAESPAMDPERQEDRHGPEKPSAVSETPRADTGEHAESTGDSLEWETPTAEEETPEERGGEPVEDVLEETPDFLRETPDQERLWFEQRPPRDFDFDK